MFDAEPILALLQNSILIRNRLHKANFNIFVDTETVRDDPPCSSVLKRMLALIWQI
jgi:hypothetical protein